MSAVQVWYQVRDLEAARAFYTQKLGLYEAYFDEEAGVATGDVDDVKAEAERLRREGIEVGTVLELHGAMRLLDVYDPDGNRIQLAEDVAPS